MDNIFQIFLCKEKYREENLREHAEFFNTARQNMLAVYPEYQYNLYTNVEAAQFVKAFSPAVHRAYWALAPFAYRADLLRLCLLYEYGGWYFDITTRPLFKFEPDKIFFAKNDSRELLENFVIYAKPQSKFLESCISNVVKNVLNRRYFGESGVAALNISGPALLSSVLGGAKEFANSVTVGVFNQDTHDIVVNDRVFATHKNKNGIIDGLNYIGFKGTNSYDNLYNNRLVYVSPWTTSILQNITDVQEIVYA